MARTTFKRTFYYECVLLVCGETPEEAAQDVAHPEEGVDQHGLVVLRAHPIVLGQTREEFIE